MLPMKRPRLLAVQPVLPFSLDLTFIDGQQLRLDLSADVQRYPDLQPLLKDEAFAGAILGDDGWSVLEIVCHLRDMEAIYMARAQRMVEADYPHLPTIDQEDLVVKNDYAHQDMKKTLGAFMKKRQEFIDWLETLNDDQWKRRGVHAESGEYSVTELAINSALHDVNHIEQILKALAN